MPSVAPSRGPESGLWGAAAERGNPFVGLRPFEPEEEHLFFGREKHSQELLRRLRRGRFLAVVGTSGSGKSSLVRAGLLPMLYGGMMSGASSRWRVALFRPGSDPIGELARALERPGVLGVETADEAEARLRATMTASTLRRSALGLGEVVRHARLPAGENLLVVVDQFEEIFRFKETTGRRSAEDSAAFIKLLLEASRAREQPIYVLLTMRSDFLGDCAQFRDLPEAINDGQFLIPRLNRGERRQTIVGPVKVAGEKVSPRLVQRLLNDVGDDPDQLPVLQHALMRTWDVWQADGAHTDGGSEVLDIDAYDQVGRLTGALSQHADEVYEELDAGGRRIAETLFKALTDTSSDPRGVRRPARLAEVAKIAGVGEDQVVEVVERFRQPGRSFLMPPAGTELGGETVLDISHESLMRVWRRLKGWAEEERRSAEEYSLLARDAARHEAGEVGLLRDPALGLAVRWRQDNAPNEAWARRYDPAFTRAMDYREASQEISASVVAEMAFEAYWRRIPRMAMLGITAVGFFLSVLYLGDKIESYFGDAIAKVVETVGIDATGVNSEPADVLKRLSVVVLAVPFLLLYLLVERLAKSRRRRPALDAIRMAMAGRAPSSQTGFLRRFAAFCLDLTVFAGLTVTMTMGLTFIFEALGEPSFGMIFAAFCATYLSAWWLYEALMFSSKRQATLGKMAFSLVVTNSAGEHLSFARATGRFFAKLLVGIIWSVPVLITLWLAFVAAYSGKESDIWMVSVPWTILVVLPFFFGRKRAFHDMLARTLVLYRPNWHKTLEAVGAHRR